MSDDQLTPFGDYMKALWTLAGCPSSRTVAGRTGISHQTVNQVVQGRILPKWETALPLVRYFRGDEAAALALWTEAREEDDASDVMMLVLPFSRVLRQWTDHDVAGFALGRALGLIKGSGFDVFQEHKHWFWSAHETGEMLSDFLDRLARGGLLWKDEHRLRYRFPPTSGGVPLTEDVMDKAVADAEKGYEPSQIRPRKDKP